MTWSRLWTACLVVAMAPQVVLAADVWMRMERDNSGVEYPGANYKAANGFPDAANVPAGHPTEPKGCKVSNATDVCSLSNTPATEYYGWPQTKSVLPNNDAYQVVTNFWNNEWTLSDTTSYSSGVILNPWDRINYSGSHSQFKIPDDFNACPPAGTPTTDPLWKTCWPTHRPASDWVHGNLVVVADDAPPTSPTSTFYVAANDGNSAGSGDRGDKNAMSWIDERHFPASYPFIYKGCHQGTCTQSGGAPAQTATPALSALAATTLTGAPFPIQLKDLDAIPSNWSVDLSSVSGSSIYDVAYDIWFEIPSRFYWQANAWERKVNDTTLSTCETNLNPFTCPKYYGGMPEAAKVLAQPWGTELMVWINAGGFAGFTNRDTPDAAAITPAGTRIRRDVSIGGITWDVWVGQGRDPKQSQPTVGTGDDSDKWYGYWNIVSYVATSSTNSLNNLNTKLFIDDMLSNSAMATVCPIDYQNGVPVTGQAVRCVKDDWFISEIGAGFEIWRDGTGLKTKSFDVKPRFRDGATRPDGQATTIPSGYNIMTDRWTDPGSDGKVRPLINWQKYIQFWANGVCAGKRLSWDIESAESFTTASDGSGLAWCSNSSGSIGRWWSSGLSRTSPCASGSSPQGTTRGKMVNVNGTNDQWYSIMEAGDRLWDKGMHGDTTIHFYCDGSEVATIPLFIDPSGRVLNPQGAPIDGATVKLLKQSGSSWPLAPPSTYTPSENPQTSKGGGFYGWDVMPGVYKVTAEKPGCWVPGNTSLTVVESPVLNVVNEPFYNVDLYLACPGPTTPVIPGGDTPGLNVTLNTTSNWTSGGASGKGGFCKTVQLTNTTSAAITGWQVTFPVEKSAIYTSWNANFSQPSNTQVRVKNLDNWVKTIQPGQTTDAGWLGFCSNRLP